MNLSVEDNKLTFVTDISICKRTRHDRNSNQSLSEGHETLKSVFTLFFGKSLFLAFLAHFVVVIAHLVFVVALFHFSYIIC